MVSLEEGREKAVKIKVFLARGCREVLVIKDEIGSVDSFRGEAHEQRLMFCVRIRRGRGTNLEVEEVQVRASG